MDTLRAVLEELPDDEKLGGDRGLVLGHRVGLLRMERRPDSLLLLLRARGGSLDSLACALDSGLAHLFRGDTLAARATFGSALVIIEGRLRTSPDDEALHADRASVLARLGRRGDALREIRWLERTNATRKQPLPHGWSRLGELFALVGDTNAALAEIERSLAHPYGMTVSWARLDPAYDGIRRDPRFQRLLVKYANPDRRQL
jgi:hypothetical protein